MVTLLLAKGADVNAKDNEGWTALMEAARVNNVEVVKILIDKGVDVNTKNNNERTALMIAKNKTWPDIVNILEKAGATIPKELIERLLTVADSQWQKEDYQNAIESYKEILSLDPNNSKAKEFLKKYSGVRFIFSDLTIKDISTRLMWTRDANIAGRPMTWFMTSTFIEKLNKQKYAGYNDWRVPTIEELETLADYVKVQGCERGCNKLFSKIGFRKVQDRYWSSSPYEDPEDRIGYWAKGIILEDGGYVFSDSMILRTYVWPVRAGQ
jgi:tetratricopeptide (TPR) repeat protein